jgi:hypothetical protein
MIAARNTKPRFKLGQVVATPGAIDALEKANQPATEFINKHVVLDAGELDEEDQQTNEDAVENGDRILSSYLLKGGTKIWIITEADRSATTLLLPSEY